MTQRHRPRNPAPTGTPPRRRRCRAPSCPREPRWSSSGAAARVLDRLLAGAGGGGGDADRANRDQLGRDRAQRRLLLRAGMAEGYAGAVERVGREANARDLADLTLEGQGLVGRDRGRGGDRLRLSPSGTALAGARRRSLAAMRRGAARLEVDGLAGRSTARACRSTSRRRSARRSPAGCISPTVGCCTRRAIWRASAGAAQRHGARLCQAEVQRLTPTAAARCVETSRGTVRAGAVIVGAQRLERRTGAGAGRGDRAGARPGPRLRADPAGLHHRRRRAVTPTGEYWQQTPDGAIVLGGCRAVAPGQMSACASWCRRRR